ncbi:MAG TPA: helix-turn-helix domain-containing protein [Candidatus Binataceae bacterium]
MAEKKRNPPAPREPAEKTLGQVLADTRMNKGFSPEEVVTQTRIPPHYVKMLESNSYSMISDQLYLLPFLRRYAAFLELDPEEIASRFVHDVQRSESSATRMQEPIEMTGKKGIRWSEMLVAALIFAAILLAGDLAWRAYGGKVMRMVTPPSDIPASSVVPNPPANPGPDAGAVQGAPPPASP